MSDDSQNRSWLERFNQLLSREPKDREQLVELLHHVTERQLISPEALTMIEGVLQVSDMQVRDVMIPRSQMAVVEQDATLEEILPIVITSAHSRFPVIGETIDEVVGILLAKDLLKFSNSNETFNINDIIRPAIFIPESKRLNILLEEFRLNRNHIAIVVDEYGGIAGMVTIEDVLEQIVGEIEDEYDTEEENQTNIQAINEHVFTVKALTPIEDFNDFFQTQFSDEEFDTIGGLVTHAFGYLPKRDENITLDHITFKVLYADKRRIRLLRVTPQKLKPQVLNKP
jgi:magnesium and cobalt transporter